jgi:AmmeMemoRadiSam system protein B
MRVRPPAVAGFFYPRASRDLGAAVRDCLARPGGTTPVPKAIIAPHAGYMYSGAVAALAYALLARARDRIRRVVLIGPSHRVPFRGLAASSADAFATPLGLVPLDREAVDALLALPQVRVLDHAHGAEHSLEVHLPFLQMVLDAFRLVPLVAGEAAPQEVAEVLDAAWGGSETLVVASSDLSHYLDYQTARRIDAATCRAIEGLSWEDVGEDQACGRIGVNGLLEAARRRRMRVRTLDLRNSGDTAGPRDEVVGYGAWAFEEAAGGAPAAGVLH